MPRKVCTTRKNLILGPSNRNNTERSNSVLFFIRKTVLEFYGHSGTPAILFPEKARYQGGSEKIERIYRSIL
ncbi:MAG: hypothetical protein PHH70_04260 [Candidatus Gracilibacteria bacterium]|nr:hypothetical protein [Candidatus Gracilibacteria bacterium]